jgi:hypothetical protein
MLDVDAEFDLSTLDLSVEQRAVVVAWIAAGRPTPQLWLVRTVKGAFVKRSAKGRMITQYVSIL